MVTPFRGRNTSAPDLLQLRSINRPLGTLEDRLEDRGTSRFRSSGRHLVMRCRPELPSGRQDLNLRPLDPQNGGVSVPARQARSASFTSEPARGRSAITRRACGPQLVPKVESTTRTVALRQVSRAVPLLAPWVAVVVVAEGLPEARFVVVEQRQPAQPLGGLFQRFTCGTPTRPSRWHLLLRWAHAAKRGIKVKP
jgi:hypothetical protein